MSKQPGAPVLLDLAPMPREQMGPFLLLGVTKDCGKEQIEANWAERVRWARRNQIKTSLEDINWAREIVNDADKRVRSDASSLNLDTTEGTLRRLAERYAKPEEMARCSPLDV